MIPGSKINAIVSGIAVNSGINIQMADQGGHKPAYPYLSWKIISSQEEGDYQNLIVPEANGDQVNLNRYEQSKQVMSLTFIGQDIQDLWAKTTTALQWIKSTACQDVAKLNNIVLRVMSNQIEDRTVYLETFYENRLGVDVRLDYYGSPIDTIEAIETIEVTPTIDEIQQEEIIITEP